MNQQATYLVCLPNSLKQTITAEAMEVKDGGDLVFYRDGSAILTLAQGQWFGASRFCGEGPSTECLLTSSTVCAEKEEIN